MRTLHKGLAMLLVVIMVLGLGAFTAVAAPTDVYADADQIDENYKEAVDVLTYIGVLEGDNGFRPTDTLTRAEGAKILTAVMGILNPTGTATSFTDVDDWAKGYVAYVEANGISDGVAENLFGSQMALTGSMFAKWLLVGLGYDADAEGMTGAPWEINIAKLVRVTGLDDGLDDYDPTVSITREMAAQMALNALKTPMVEYGSNITVNNGGSLVTIKNDVSNVTSGASYASNISTKGDSTSNTNRPYLELGEQYWRNLKLVVDADDLGRPTNFWSYGSEAIGTYISTSNLIFSSTREVKKSELYNAIGRNHYNELDENDGNVTMKVIIDGTGAILVEGSGHSGADNLGDYLQNSGNNGIGTPAVTGNGTCTELYRVENGDTIEYTLVIVNTFLVKATSDYSEANKSVKVTTYVGNNQNTGRTLGITEIKQSDFDVSNVLKDEYLLITASYDTPSKYKVQSVEPATLLTGEVESYTASYKNPGTNVGDVTSKVKIDGTEYSYNALIGTDATYGGMVAFSIGRNATVVLDQYGNIALVDEADAGADARYVYVDEASYSLGLKARAYFLDGTTQTIDVKKVGDVVANINHQTAGTNDVSERWWSYTTDDSGRYTLSHDSNKDAATAGTAISYISGDTANNTVTNKNNVKFLASNNAAAPAGTDKTILIVVDDGDVTVYQGAANMPKIVATRDTVTVKYLTDSAITYTKYAFIKGTKLDIEGGARNEDLLFVLEKGKGTGSDRKLGTYEQVNVVLNGETKNNLLVDDEFVGSLTVGKLYTNLKYNEAGWLNGADLVGNVSKEFASLGNNTTDQPISATANTLYFGNSTAVNVSNQNANVNLLIEGGLLGTTGLGIKTDYLSTGATAAAKVINDYLDTHPGTTVAYDVYVAYSSDHDGSGNGVAKAVYIYVYSGHNHTTAIVDDNALQALFDSYTVVNLTGSANLTDTDITVPADRVLNIGNGVTVTATASLTNNGTINISTGGKLDVDGATVDNYGTVNVVGGTLSMAGTTWNENSANSLHLLKGTATGTVYEMNVKGSGKVEIAKGITLSSFTITTLTVEAGATVAVTEDVEITTADIDGTLTVGQGANVDVGTLTGDGKITAADSTDVSVTVTTDSSNITSDLVGYGGTITITGSGFVSSSPAASGNGTYTIDVDASTTTITINVDETTATALSSYSDMQTDLTNALSTSGATATIAVSSNKVTITITQKPTVGAWSFSFNLDTPKIT